MRRIEGSLLSLVRRASLGLALALILVVPRPGEATEQRWAGLTTENRMPASGFTVTEFQGRIWVLGGEGASGSGTPNRILHSQEGITWAAPAGAPAFLERREHAAVVLGDFLYVLGGESFQGVPLADVWRSADGLNWTQVESAAPFGPRSRHAAAVHQGQLWIIGGQGPSGAPLRSAWMTPNGIGWISPLADFPVARRGHRMVSHEGYLWVVGGEVSDGYSWDGAEEIWHGPRAGIWTPDPERLEFDVRTQGLFSEGLRIWAFGADNFENAPTPVAGIMASLRQADGDWANLPTLRGGIEYNRDQVVRSGERFYRIGPWFSGPNVHRIEDFHRLSAAGAHGQVDFTGEGVVPAPDGHYRSGTAGFLVPQPDAGYVFVGWSGDAQGDANPHPLTLDRDKTITALFQPAHPTVTVQVNGPGRVSPFGVVSVPRGSSPEFTLRPQPGSRVAEIKVDGQSVEVRSPLVLSNVVDNHTVEVAFSSCTPVQIAPNHVVVRTYADELAVPVTRYLVPDGFGNTAQSQLDLGGGSFLVSANSVDGVGLPTKEVKPYVAEGRSAFLFDPLECDDMIRRANAYYDGSTPERPNAQDYAYSEVRYAPEPAARHVATGLPGRAFSTDADLGGNPTRLWRFGADGPEAFLGAADLAPWDLDARESPDGSQYHLTVVRDGNGHYSQTLHDAFGHPIGQWGNPDPADDTRRAQSRAEFDVLGRLTREVPPLGEDAQSLQTHTLSGALISDVTPDGGATEYRYDADGRLRFVKSARHRARDLEEPSKNHYLRFAYDALGRLVAVSENNGNHSFDSTDRAPSGDSLLLKRFQYDAFILAELEALGLPVDPAILQAVAIDLEVHPGQLAAAFAYGPGAHRTVDLFSRDARGFLKAQYRFLPGRVPVQKVEFTYDPAGKPLEEVYYNGYDTAQDQWVAENLRTTHYDALERPQQVDLDGQRRFAYSYQTNGALARENLYAPSGAPVEELGYTYTAQDWVDRLATPGSTPRFEVDLEYGGLFNGSLASAEYAYQLDATTRQEKAYLYGYDGMDRLTDVLTPSGVAGTYSYDAQGRLTAKEEEGSSLPAYDYVPGKNQVRRIPGHVYKGHPNTYVYDPEGNLVLDRSKKMTLDYDPLGQAVAFRVYQDLPEVDLTWEDVRDNGLETRHGRVLLEKTEMAYDAFGQRVYKHHKSQSGEEAVAYVGAFAELASLDGDGPWSLAAVNHWTMTGLRGRREGAGEYTYLTDHMGSVRMGLNAAGQVVEAVDYTAFGQVRRLGGSNLARARAGYTEKEEDGETGLTYFGARYLDAELGSWTAVDPLGQYHHGYSFVGGNPINFIDRWGLEGESNSGDGTWPETWKSWFQDRGGDYSENGDGGQEKRPPEPQPTSNGSDISFVDVRPPRARSEATLQELPAWHPDGETPQHRLAREAQDWYNERYSETGQTRYALGYSVVALYKMVVPETNRDANRAMSSGGTGPIKAVQGAARGMPKVLDISSKQFGKKLGQKARELGLDPSNARDRFGLQSRIQRIFNNADEVRTSLWRGLGEGGKEGPALFFRRGSDVVVTTPGGGFVTLLQGGSSNARFLSGTVIP